MRRPSAMLTGLARLNLVFRRPEESSRTRSPFGRIQAAEPLPRQALDPPPPLEPESRFGRPALTLGQPRRAPSRAAIARASLHRPPVSLLIIQPLWGWA